MADPIQRLEASIRSPRAPGPAIMPYLTAGYPEREGFGALLREVGAVADAIEVGVPFSDPMADGATIQRAGRAALEAGVTLRWILQEVRAASPEVNAPIVLMSYLNPLLAYGLEALVDDAAAAGICAFIVPDLPWEESGELRTLAEARGLGMVQLVTPVTPPERLARLARGSAGFVYAVTITGITGGSGLPTDLAGYLDRVRAVSPVPVCAGFGIRTAADVAALDGHADGAVVGSALIDALDRGVRAEDFVRRLRSFG